MLSAHLVALLGENSLFKQVGEAFHPLLVLVATVLAFIYGIVHNYAIAIILLTILIMGLLTPLTIKSTKSMIAMQQLQPEMQKLRAKYKGPENREQLNTELMRLYKEAGVSPMGGCVPMFLQMPALYVLYSVLRGLTNTITKGQTFPTGTVLPSGAVTTAHQKCMESLCAVPRYVPSSSTMYKHLVATPGVMNAFGMNLALKPLSPQPNWWNHIPYFVFVIAAVGLQYFQMAQMTRRNQRAGQPVPQQMQTMQRVMPIVFAYIYFLIPAGVVIYMIVSSAIRILTQDLIFRTGMVPKPGEREIGGNGKGSITAKSTEKPTEKPKGTGAPKAVAGGAAALAPGEPPTTNGNDQKDADTPAKPSGGSATKPGGSTGGGQQKKPGAKGADSGDQGANGATANGAKPHPRSKSKRSRKAR